MGRMRVVREPGETQGEVEVIGRGGISSEHHARARVRGELQNLAGKQAADALARAALAT